MDLPPDGSVTHWLGALKAGDAAAAQHLWERYFDRLVRLARAKLRAMPRSAADETLRRVALLRMEGCSDEEIATRVDYSLRTVSRKPTLIRKAWLREGAS
jgi:DNA-directed RNA polymerase specialized sigma24 family protein